MQLPQSAAAGTIWPALPNPTNSLLLALQYQLEQSQWLSPAELEQMQMRQLTVLLSYARETVPFYRQRLSKIQGLGEKLLTIDDLRSLSLLKRQELQQYSQSIRTQALPQDHQPIQVTRTSGSTGRAIDVCNTRVTDLMFRAFNLRNHLWHKRNLLAKVAAIRIIQPQNSDNHNSKKAWADAFYSGPVVELDISTTIDRQLAWLLAEKPEYLLTYPTNLLALIKRSRELEIKLPFLKEISTFGELLTPDLRSACRSVWGLPIADVYSAKEVGMIALQCPEHEHYHVQSENVLVEVLDERDLLCRPGQVGRVVLTVLHNYAMPLIRYEIGDYALWGDACPCGRSLPVLKKIIGRKRNMLVMPNGETRWPGFISSKWAKIESIRQVQAIQRTKTDIEVKLVVGSELSINERKSLEEKIASDFENQFNLSFCYVSEIPRTEGGKYEDFMSEVI
jgi:phenylacetate-CoA ligase